MKIFLALIFCTLIYPLGTRCESTGGGNGGDTIRMRFLQIGENVVKYHQDTLQGISEIVTSEQLLKTLNISVVSLSKNQLYDNAGNPVDAIGKKGSIILYSGNANSGDGWNEILKNLEIAEKMTLHEMLRAAGVNDDNYHYSKIILERSDRTSENSPYYFKWCQDSAEVLKVALNSSFYSKNFKEETETLLTAIDSVLKIVNPKNFYYFSGTLRFIRKTVESMPNFKQRAIFLRSAVKDALEDVRLFDKIDGDGDHRLYVRETIKRGLREAFSSDPFLEDLILLSAVTRAIYFLDESDHRRTSSCARVQLEFANRSSATIMRRKHLQSALKILETDLCAN